MISRRLLPLLPFALALLALPTHLYGDVPPRSDGFEETAGDLPPGWSVEGPGEAGASVSRDTELPRSGKASLRIRHPKFTETSVVSSPVTLAVGHVYRLSAWIRTEGALSEPAARYPTALPATVGMTSFPFTNHSATVGGTSSWRKVEAVFVATSPSDRIRLGLGQNGGAEGTAWFDDVALEEVADVRELVPMETVRWAGEGFRYDDRGWIFVHVEGEPYARGWQFGSLVSEEIVAYVSKLSVNENGKDPAAGWNTLRLLADTAFLRGFDEEYLAEMRGIAEGAARSGAKVDGRAVDLLDVVTLNSAVDISQLASALRGTPHALTGRSFLDPADEMEVPDERHKCSGLLATGPATSTGRVVFGQLFMWGGYTGVHFNVLCDVVPAKGQRLVYQTFPGGIHSGTDFYMNGAGIVLGETTVAQTPFERTGTPQSNRARKAAQYATSIDEAARILRQGNNGLYTNDWLLADVKTDEVAIFLLGTKRDRLWKSNDRPAPFGTPGFLWSDNNARDEGVRREYAVQPEDAPADVVYSPSNRDVAFLDFYRAFRGKIDVAAAVRLFASSPVERPHACDGKVTSSEMAEKLVFLAHFGKTTLREKFPAKESRRMPDLPGAFPHLSLGYSAWNPVWVTDRLKKARKVDEAAKPPKAANVSKVPNVPNVPKVPKEAKVDLSAVADRYAVSKDKLWRGSLFPKTDADGWLASGSAATWQLLHGLKETPEKAAAPLRDELAGLNARLAWVIAREGERTASLPARAWDQYGSYLVPRIRGTFALHQLRLLIGNGRFLDLMKGFHAAHAGKEVTRADFVAAASKAAGLDVSAFLSQWLDRTGLPDLAVAMAARAEGAEWVVDVTVTQKGTPYHFLASVAVETGGAERWHPVEVKGEKSTFALRSASRPVRAVFDAGRDVPVPLDRPYAWVKFADDFAGALLVYGTSRQEEAQRTLALRWQATLADAWTEVLPPVGKDTELGEAELAAHDLIVLGPPSENALTARIADRLPVTFGRGWFRWQGVTYGRPDDGLFLVVPNPFNPKRALYLFAPNSALELWQMTKNYSPKLPSWAVFRADEVKLQGYHPPSGFVVDLLPN